MSDIETDSFLGDIFRLRREGIAAKRYKQSLQRRCHSTQMPVVERFTTTGIRTSVDHRIEGDRSDEVLAIAQMQRFAGLN